jgi:hypothetical protein
MQCKAWTPVLNRSWTQGAEAATEGQLSWAPTVEIRRSNDNLELETWFHFVTHDGPILKRIGADSTSPLLQLWRSFADRCATYEADSRDVGWLSGFIGKAVLKDRRWRDEQGREVGALQLIQGGYRMGETGLRIGLDTHRHSASVPAFVAWLEALEELHKPFLPAATQGS